MRARLFQSLAAQVAEEGLVTNALSSFAGRAFGANGVAKLGFQCSLVSTSAAPQEASSSRGSGDQGRLAGGRQDRAGRQAPAGSDGAQRADRAKQGFADAGRSRSLFRRDGNTEPGSRGGDGQRGDGQRGGGGQFGGQRAGQQQGGRQHGGGDRQGGDRRGGGGGGGPPPMLRDGRDGRDGRGGGRPFLPSSGPSARSPRSRRWDVLDVAASNAPQRLLQLVGDPRSGVADDTSASAFGEVTVEMLHHQASNEVYWYKYAFAGGQPGVRGGHRDGRLSDYSRNLAYLMRAKDPTRWSVEALADKFRVRPQRMLAALALKELESQRLEAGALLGGPLSAYRLRVALADVHLDKDTGAPRLRLRLRPSSAPGAAGGGGGGGGGSAQDVLLGRTLPRVVSATQRTQAALLSALRPHGFDVAALRAALLADVGALEAAAAELDAAAGAEGDKAAGVAAYLAPELAACRAAVEAVAAAVEGVVSASPLLQEERQAAALRAQVETALRAGAGSGSGDKAAAPASAGAGAADAAAGGGEALEALLQPLTQDGAGAPLQRFLFSLPPPTRAALLRQLPRLAAQLSAAGVDLERAGRDASYRGPLASAVTASTPAGSKQQRQRQGAATSAASSSNSKLPRLAVDVLGFVPVSEAAAEALAAAVEGAAAAEAALVAKLEALQVAAGEGATPATEAEALTAPSGAELRDARALLRQYVGAHCMWEDLRAAARTAAGHSPDIRSKRRKMEVMDEADPAALTRALQVEAHTQLRRSRDRAAADSLKAGVAASAAAEAAAASGAEGAKPPTPLSDPAGWDALAAWLDVKVAGRVYARGSGERHVVRLPTYPAFEGYPLSELDRAREGELSQLNRLVAARTAAAQWAAFRRDLLFNLGVRGEKLRDSALPGAPAWPANLRSELVRPVVVYGIGPEGATQYPPLYVAAGDGSGSKRPLNEQEKVYQERRLPGPRLPYYMGRIRTLPEIN